MLESGSSGSVRVVLSNEHPYREPGPLAEVARLIQSTSFIQRTILGQSSSNVRLPMNRFR